MTDDDLTTYKPGVPYAEVRPTGRWCWWVQIHDGHVMSWAGFRVYGSRARADRKAARELAKRKLELDRWADVHRVDLP